MRGTLNSTFEQIENCKTMIQIFHQEVSDVEQKVKKLQARVGDLMIVIVDHVTPKDEKYTNETVVNTAEGIEQHIKELLRCDLRMGSLTASDDITGFWNQSMRI